MIYIYFKFSNPIQSLCDTTWRKFVAGSLKSVLVIYLFIYLFFFFSTLALKPNLKSGGVGHGPRDFSCPITSPFSDSNGG